MQGWSARIHESSACPGLPLPRDTAAAVLERSCSCCCLWESPSLSGRARTSGTVGIRSGKPGTRGQAQRGSQRPGFTGIGAGGLQGRVTLLCTEPADICWVFAGLCPSLLARVPPGQLWLLQRMSWEHTQLKASAVPWSLCWGRMAVPAALPAPSRPAGVQNPRS